MLEVGVVLGFGTGAGGFFFTATPAFARDSGATATGFSFSCDCWMTLLRLISGRTFRSHRLAQSEALW